MAFYNLATPEGREALRADRQGELDAIRQGTWPRDVDDVVRWTAPRTTSPVEWATKMCQADLDYLAQKARA